MKKFIKLLSLTLAVTTLMVTSAMAAPEPAPANGLIVKVNGEIVDFPDGQPFVDANNRTLIPVRFVAEELGVHVEWDAPNKTAVLTKGSTEIAVKLGCPDLLITSEGVPATVNMDTEAILRNNRVYVPIRFIAEAMGAQVDYSGKYDTVGIFADVLSPTQIARLQAYPYTQPDYAIGYDLAKLLYDEQALGCLYGDRSGMDSFANAREHLYHAMDRANIPYTFSSLKMTVKPSDTDTFFRNVVDEAIAEINYESPRLSIKFYTDESCIYQADSMDRSTATVRGIAEAKLHVSPLELESEETAQLCSLGFEQLYQDTPMRHDVDVHMNTQAAYNINIHTIVPLGDKLKEDFE